MPTIKHEITVRFEWEEHFTYNSAVDDEEAGVEADPIGMCIDAYLDLHGTDFEPHSFTVLERKGTRSDMNSDEEEARLLGELGG